MMFVERVVLEYEDLPSWGNRSRSRLVGGELWIRLPESFIGTDFHSAIHNSKDIVMGCDGDLTKQ